MRKQHEQAIEALKGTVDVTKATNDPEGVAKGVNALNELKALNVTDRRKAKDANHVPWK